ncbi:MAG: energy transducer TonB [Rickettsia endosymbiont of Bryobia graminum]|nr:energy transducer TonB [Rickettsia endosymbiont of Bryobia graminum]
MKNNLDRFSISFFCSIAIHLLVIYFFLFGLPSLFKKLPEEQVIVFEMLPVSDKSNVPNKTKQLEKAIENEDAKKVEQNRPAPKQEEPKLTEEKKPEPKVEQLKPIEEKKPESKPIEEKKPEPKINQKPIEQKKSPEKKKADKTDLDSLLKNLEQSSEGTNSKSNKQARSKENNEIKESRGPYDDSKSLSISESALIKQQIERQWNVPIGAENIEQVKINLYIAINTDGSIKEVKLDSATCPNISNNICSALSNSAIRAVWQASPIKNLLPDRYETWKEFILTFDPSRML